jgi:hypothetical protein
MTSETKSTHRVLRIAGVAGAVALASALVVLLVAGIAIVGRHAMVVAASVFALGDTEYAEGFDEAAFRGIALGQPEASVHTTLGAPLEERPTAPFTLWLYATDPVPGFAVDGSLPGGQTSFTCLHFDEHGGFEGASGQVARGVSWGLFGASTSVTIGDGENTLKLTDAEIERLRGTNGDSIARRFGPPDARYTSQVVRWLHYSRSPGSTHHRQCRIGIDRDGRVCAKIDRLYFD